MAGTSKGRGTAAVFGMLLVLAGLAGAAVLWVLAAQRPDRAVEAFARGPVGCTVTLEFTDTGTFYVYEELVAADHPVFDTCAPVPATGAPFAAELLDGTRSLALRDDTSVSYDTDIAVGTSIGRVEIVEPGRYRLVVRGDDASRVAAVGRDPDEGVRDLQRGAIAVGVVGIVLGGLMLLLAGRRSKRAATVSTPEPPHPMRPASDAEAAWPPSPPNVQVPMSTLPQREAPTVETTTADDERAWPPAPPKLEVPTPPPGLVVDADAPSGSASWAPPVPGEGRVELPPPGTPEPPAS